MTGSCSRLSVVLLPRSGAGGFAQPICYLVLPTPAWQAPQLFFCWDTPGHTLVSVGQMSAIRRLASPPAITARSLPMGEVALLPALKRRLSGGTCVARPPAPFGLLGFVLTLLSLHQEGQNYLATNCRLELGPRTPGSCLALRIDLYVLTCALQRHLPTLAPGQPQGVGLELGSEPLGWMWTGPSYRQLATLEARCHRGRQLGLAVHATSHSTLHPFPISLKK